MMLQREPMTTALFDEARLLIETHFARFDPFPELPLDVDVAGYEALEDAGCLRIYTARTDHLRGYAVFMLSRSLRRRYLWQAQQDMLHAESPMVTRALLKYAEEALREDGVRLIYQSGPMGFGRLLELFGYREFSRLHAKTLGGTPWA